MLVLGDEIVHVALGFSEFHLIHTLTGVPVQESLSSEHSGKLFAYSLEELLDGGGVTDEGGAHLESSWWDVTNGGLDVVWDPFDEIQTVKGMCLKWLKNMLKMVKKGAGMVEISEIGEDWEKLGKIGEIG